MRHGLIIFLALGCCAAALRSPKDAEVVAQSGALMVRAVAQPKRIRTFWKEPFPEFSYRVLTSTNLFVAITNWTVLTNLTTTSTVAYAFLDAKRFFAVEWSNRTERTKGYVTR